MVVLYPILWLNLMFGITNILSQTAERQMSDILKSSYVEIFGTSGDRGYVNFTHDPALIAGRRMIAMYVYEQASGSWYLISQGICSVAYNSVTNTPIGFIGDISPEWVKNTQWKAVYI